MLEIFNSIDLVGTLVDFADVTVKGSNYFCTNLKPVINLMKSLVKLLQWLVPMGLIVYGLLDMGKAVIAGKEDEMKKATSTLIKRVVYAVATFFVVTIVYFAMGLVGSKDWNNCWNNVGKAQAGEVE